MRFESNLKLLRLNRMLSQEEVSAAIHVSRSTYAQYERGARRPDLDTLYRLAELYNVRVDFLVRFENRRFINELNLYVTMNDEAEPLIDIFNSLSLPAKGRLLERAMAIKEADEEMFRAEKGITTPYNCTPEDISDEEVCKNFLKSHGIRFSKKEFA